MKTSTWTAQLTVASPKAQHYLNSLCTTPKRSPSRSKFYVDFKKKLFSRIKKLKLTFFFLMFCALSAFLWAENLSCSIVLPPKSANVHRTAFFLHTPDFSLSKVTALKVVWGKDTSRRRKKPGSDLPSCFSAYAPFYKCGWRHHISRYGCGPDCFMQKLRVCALCSSLLTYKRELCLICIPPLLIPGWT